MFLSRILLITRQTEGKIIRQKLDHNQLFIISAAHPSKKESCLAIKIFYTKITTVTLDVSGQTFHDNFRTLLKFILIILFKTEN